MLVELVVIVDQLFLGPSLKEGCDHKMHGASQSSGEPDQGTGPATDILGERRLVDPHVRGGLAFGAPHERQDVRVNDFRVSLANAVRQAFLTSSKYRRCPRFRLSEVDAWLASRALW